jgi:outer membrane receptor for ferrienterochelin and colicins
MILKVRISFNRTRPVPMPLPLLLSAFVPAPRAEPGAGSAAEAGEIIVITGARLERPLTEEVVATTVLTRAQIEASGARTLAELLSAVPGVEVLQTVGGTAARLGGLEPEHTLLLVDGQRALGRVSGVIDLDRYDLSDIEQVEIVRGPSAALYGSDAMGGVIHLRTRRTARPWQAHLAAHGGVYLASARPAAGVATGPLSASWAALPEVDVLDLAAGLGLRRGGVEGRVDLGVVGRQAYVWEEGATGTSGDRHSQVDLGGGVGWRRSDGDRVEVGGGLLQREEIGVDASATGAVYDRVVRTETAELRLSPRILAGEGTVLSGTASFGTWREQYLSDQRRADAMDSYSDTRHQQGEVFLQVDRALGARRQHVLTTGLEGAAEHMVSDRLEEGAGARSRGAVLVQDEWAVLPERRLVLVPGARLDGDTWYGLHPTPKLALRWDPTERLALRLSGGGGFRAPDFKELLLAFDNSGVGYRVQGNPDLLPEHSWTLTGGVEWATAGWGGGGALALALGGQGTTVRDLVSVELVDEGAAGSPALYSYVNVAHARTAQVDATATLGAGPVDLDLGFTGMHTRDLELGRPLPGRPTHRLTAGLLAAPWPERVDLSLRGTVSAGRRFYDEADAVVLPGPVVEVDAQLRGHLRPGLSVELNGRNLAQAGDETWFPLRPRQVSAGLTWKPSSPDHAAGPSPVVASSPTLEL